MLWLLLILITVFVWAFINVYDKHIVSDELRDPFLCTVIYGFIMFVSFGLVFFLTKQKFLFNVNFIMPSFIAGIVLAGAIFFYYKSLSYEEVSRVMPMLELIPLL